MKDSKFKIGMALILILIIAVLVSSYNYNEPTDGLSVDAGIRENGEELEYFFETDFISKARYTVGFSLYFPMGQEFYKVELLKESKFRAKDGTTVYDDSIKIQDIKDAILNLEHTGDLDLILAAENWRDYDYYVSMHRSKFFKTYDAVAVGPIQVSKD